MTKLFGSYIEEAGPSSDVIIQSVENLNDDFDNFVESNKVKPVFSESISDDMKQFHHSRVMSSNLQKLKDALETLQISSILPERAFSIAGNFVRARRTRLSDEVVDSLLILSYLI